MMSFRFFRAALDKIIRGMSISKYIVLRDTRTRMYSACSFNNVNLKSQNWNFYLQKCVNIDPKLDKISLKKTLCCYDFIDFNLTLFEKLKGRSNHRFCSKVRKKVFLKT